MGRINSNTTSTIYFEIAVTSGFVFILWGILIYATWIGIIVRYIKQANKKILDLKRLHDDELAHDKIVNIHTDVTKYKLMLAVLTIDQLMSILIFIQLVGTQLPQSVDPGQCYDQKYSLIFLLFNTGTAPYTLIICMTCTLAMLVFHMKHSLNKHYNTKVIFKMSAWITVQLVVLVPLNLIHFTNYISNYLYIACNIVNLVLVYRGAKQLGRVLKWRTQDATYSFNLNSRRTQAYRRIERNYKIMTTFVLSVLGTVLVLVNLDLLIDKCIIPIFATGGCTRNLLREELRPIVDEFNFDTLVHNWRVFFLALRFTVGFVWGLFSIMLYTAVIIKMWIQQRRKPKCVRFKVDYSKSYLSQPLLRPMS